MFTFCAQWLWGVCVREVSASMLVVFFTVLLLVRLLQILTEVYSLPPGPWGLPVVGSLPFIKSDMHLYFRDLTHKYGSLLSTRLGSQLIVVISDYKLIRDSFRKDEFTGRPTTEFTNILGGYGKSRFFLFLRKLN